jgi:hypothetical protein
MTVNYAYHIAGARMPAHAWAGSVTVGRVVPVLIALDNKPGMRSQTKGPMLSCFLSPHTSPDRPLPMPGLAGILKSY